MDDAPTWRLTREFETEGGTVRWDVLGAGEPVVLVHGTPFSSFIWRDIARGLAAQHTVYVWDLLGYGSSDQREDHDVSLAAQGRILAALLEHWGLDEPHMVAHDFGGATALRALLLEGRRYRSLALADVVALAPWGTPFFRLARDNFDVFTQIPEMHHEAMLRAQIRTATHQPLRAPVLDALVAPWLGPQGQRAYYRQIAQNDQRYTDEVQPRYPSVDIPTLVLWGEHDGWLPPAQAEELHGLLPDSRLRWIPKAGHLVQEDAPGAVLGELTAFWRRATR